MAATRSRPKPKPKTKPAAKPAAKVAPARAKRKKDAPTFAQRCVFFGILGLSACAAYGTFAYGDEHAVTWTRWGRYAINGSVGMLAVGLGIMLVTQFFSGWTTRK
ncbi:MAG: hypothetical protein GC159_12730 [Phycisphaera sp.]|nr:hypothetical protein [Phycisphaera sp.]